MLLILGPHFKEYKDYKVYNWNWQTIVIWSTVFGLPAN